MKTRIELDKERKHRISDAKRTRHLKRKKKYGSKIKHCLSKVKQYNQKIKKYKHKANSNEDGVIAKYWDQDKKFVYIIFVVLATVSAIYFCLNVSPIIVSAYNNHIPHEYLLNPRDYGKIPKKLYPHASSRYELYYSQKEPVKIPDGCEAASLLDAMAIRGHKGQIDKMAGASNNQNDEVAWLCHKIGYKHNGKYSSPNQQYSHDPFKHLDGSINPPVIAKWAKKLGGNAVVANHLSKYQIIANLKKGNPIIMNVSHHKKLHVNDHTICLITCKKRNGHLDVLSANPNSKKSLVRWHSLHKVLKAYRKPSITHEYSCIITD